MHLTVPEQIEAQIRDHRLFECPVDWSSDLIFPYYNGLSLPNVTQAITQILGVPLPEATPLLDTVWQGALPQAQRVVVALIDGLGYKHLQMLMDEDAEVADAVHELNGGRAVVPLTSVAPSTTVVALTSLWTGHPPAITGISGTSMFLKELSLLADMLTFQPVVGQHPQDVIAGWGHAPEKLVQSAGLSTYLQAQGIKTYAITRKMFVGSGLSRILHRGVDHTVTHLGLGDFAAQTHQTLKATQGTRSYISIYWSGVDSLAHQYGAHHPYTNQDAREKILALRDLMRDETLQDGETVFMILSDHGHYDSTNPIVLGDDDYIRNAMQMSLAGDERHAYLYAKHGTVDGILERIHTHYADRLTAIESLTALQAGYFGTGSKSAIADRIGDVLLLPRLGHIISDPVMGTYSMVSRHAGLSDWEMLIPFLWHTL